MSKAYTLIELVFVIAIISIILAVIFFPINYSFENFGKQTRNIENVSNLRSGMDYLTRELRAGEKVTIEGEKIKIDGEVYWVDSGSLLKNNQVIVSGIDRLNAKIVDDKLLEIDLTTVDKNGEELKVSSSISFR